MVDASEKELFVDNDISIFIYSYIIAPECVEQFFVFIPFSLLCRTHI